MLEEKNHQLPTNHRQNLSMLPKQTDRRPGCKPSFYSACFYILASVWLTGCATVNEHATKSKLNKHAEMAPSPSTISSTSQRTAEPDGTLQSYIAYGIKHSAELKAQFERWNASVHRISSARRLPDPVISYGYYISQVETRVGPQRHKLSLKQTFPWPTRLTAGADAAAARSKAAQDRFDAMAIAVASRVEQYYWRIWKLQEVRKIQQDNAAVLTALSESANAMLMTGRIDLSEQQQIDLARARVEDVLQMLDEQQVQTEAALRGVINAPPDMAIRITSTPQLDSTSYNEEELLAAVKSHPNLLSYHALAQSSALDAEKEKTVRYPNFTLSVDWIETGDAQNPDTPDSGKDAFIAGIGISLPIWQGSYEESVDAFAADEKAHLADGEAATNAAVAQFYQTLSQLRDAKRRVALYETTLVPQAESVYESVLGAYAGGRSNATTTLSAQQNLLELRIQLVSAQAEILTQTAALKNIVGRDLPSANNNNGDDNDPGTQGVKP